MAEEQVVSVLKTRRKHKRKAKRLTEEQLGTSVNEYLKPKARRQGSSGRSKTTQFKEGAANPKKRKTEKPIPTPEQAEALHSLGTPSAAQRRKKPSEEEQRSLAQRTGLTPLEYLVYLLRDPKIPLGIKIEAAKAAAPYMHKRMPIAIESSDANKPIRLDLGSLQNLNRAEIATLRALLLKTGLVRIPQPVDPNDVAQRLLAETVDRGAQTLDGECSLDGADAEDAEGSA